MSSELTAASDPIDFFDGLVAEKYREIPEDIAFQEEMEIAKEFSPSTNDFLIRKRIYELLHRQKALQIPKRIRTGEVWKGICSEQRFYKMLKMEKSYYRVAWWFLPLHENMDVIHDAARHGLLRARQEILTMSLHKDTYGHFIKLLEILVNRSMGPVVQKIDKRSVNLHYGKNDTRSVSQIDYSDPKQLESKLEELKSKMLRAPVNVVESKDPE